RSARSWAPTRWATSRSRGCAAAARASSTASATPASPTTIRWSPRKRVRPRSSRCSARSIPTMPEPGRGRLDLAGLTRAAGDRSIHTVTPALPDLFGRLVGKRIHVRFFLDAIAAGGMHVCDYLLACDMEMDPTPGYAFTNWESGYGDLHAVPDLATLRRAAW